MKGVLYGKNVSQSLVNRKKGYRLLLFGHIGRLFFMQYYELSWSTKGIWICKSQRSFFEGFVYDNLYDFTRGEVGSCNATKGSRKNPAHWISCSVRFFPLKFHAQLNGFLHSAGGVKCGSSSSGIGLLEKKSGNPLYIWPKIECRWKMLSLYTGRLVKPRSTKRIYYSQRQFNEYLFMRS